MSHPVLVIGGTGVFGRAIVEGMLASPCGFRVIVAARRRENFAREFGGQAATPEFAEVDDI